MPLVDQGALGGLAAGIKEGLGSLREAQEQARREELQELHRMQALGFDKDPETGGWVESPLLLARERRKAANDKLVRAEQRDAQRQAKEEDFGRQKELADIQFRNAQRLKAGDYANSGREKEADRIARLQAEAMQQGMGYLDPQTGQFVATAPSPQEPGSLSPKQRKDITADAWAAGQYAHRMENAENTFGNLKAGGYDAAGAGSAVRRSMQDVPLVGGLLGQLRTTRDRQQEQAERDFVNALLRKESGAAISPAEFENAAKQYFPRGGDSDAVLEQKRVNRLQAFAGLKAQAGRAYEAIPSMSGQNRLALPSQKQKGLMPNANAQQKPKRVIQNGHEYILNEKTGQYE